MSSNGEKALNVINKTKVQASEKIPLAVKNIKKQIQDKGRSIMRASLKKKVTVAVAGLIGINIAWSYFSQPGSYIADIRESTNRSKLSVDLDDIRSHTDRSALHGNLKAQVAGMMMQKLTGEAEPPQVDFQEIAGSKVDLLSERTANSMITPESLYSLFSGHKYSYRKSNPSVEPRNKLLKQGHTGIGEYQATLWDAGTGFEATIIMDYQMGTWKVTNITLPEGMANLF